MTYTNFYVYTKGLKKEIIPVDFPSTCKKQGIKIENEFLKHHYRCKDEDLEKSETTLQLILEEYLKNNFIESYRITI